MIFKFPPFRTIGLWFIAATIWGIGFKKCGLDYMPDAFQSECFLIYLIISLGIVITSILWIIVDIIIKKK